MFVSTLVKPMMTYLVRRSLRQRLRSMSDRQLEDCGISRYLLDSGVKAYPWRESVETVSYTLGTSYANRVDRAAGKALTSKDLQRGADELMACSDAELRDLGITRGSIREAVRYGRPGIDISSLSEAA